MSKATLWRSLLDGAETSAELRIVTDVSVAYLVVLIALAAGMLPTATFLIERAKVTEALTLARTHQTEALLSRSYTGEWPEPEVGMLGREPTDLSGRFVYSAALQPDGVVRVVMRDETTDGPGQPLSFRSAVHAQHSSAPVFWLCGQRRALPGYAAAPPLAADLPPNYYPHVCRDQRASYQP
ncbi:MAG: hypothetical protein AAGF46_04755 [Pseudomonadota bacterium]